MDQPVSTDSGDVTAEVDEEDAVDEDDEGDETKRDTEREQKKKIWQWYRNQNQENRGKAVD